MEDDEFDRLSFGEQRGLRVEYGFGYRVDLRDDNGCPFVLVAVDAGWEYALHHRYFWWMKRGYPDGDELEIKFSDEERERLESVLEELEERLAEEDKWNSPYG